MNRISFHAVLTSTDADRVASVLGEWVKAGKLQVKDKFRGIEIGYEDERIYVYGYDESTSGGRPPDFLLEGHMAGTLDQAKTALIELIELARSQQIRAEAEYVEVDEKGNEVSELFQVEPGDR